MNYRTENEILLEMVRDARDKNLIRTSKDLLQNIREGKQTENQYVLDLSTHAYILHQLEQENYENSMNTDIATATGEALDTLGRLVNVARIPAQPLLLEVIVGTGVALQENITVPSGTKVLLSHLFDNIDYEFRTTEDLTIPSGSTEAKVMAESSILGYRGNLPYDSVTGLEGFPQLSAHNQTESTAGRNIETDDDYRERIRMWASGNQRGTREMIETYLNNYEGIDGYHLIPCDSGPGTLTLVVDTIPSLLEQIARDVYDDCMLLTDLPPACIPPAEHLLLSLDVTVSLRDVEMRVTLDELKSIIRSHVMIYVDGGTTRNGNIVQGLTIGESFVPAQLVAFLVDEIREINNLTLDETSIITVEPTEKFAIGNVDVVIV